MKKLFLIIIVLSFIFTQGCVSTIIPAIGKAGTMPGVRVLKKDDLTYINITYEQGNTQKYEAAEVIDSIVKLE